MTRLAATVALAGLLGCASPAVAAEHYPVRGMIVRVNPEARTFTASIEAIPNFMPAMAMPFEVREATELNDLAPGALVEFALVVEGGSSHAERVRVVPYPNAEQDPFSAQRLTLLNELVRGRPKIPALHVGDAIPDFELLDQRRQPVRLSALRGKLVAVNFVYTRCALPNYCLRLANNFGVLQKRFPTRVGRDLVLLTVSFDPEHDTADVLAAYAAQWRADPRVWHFLSGPAADVERVCRLFGVHAFPNEGLMDHSLHTVLIDRQGRLAANIEGNQYSAAQLGDLAEELMKR